MTKEELLSYIETALDNVDSKEVSISTERNKDKIELYVRTWNKSEKYAISVKRME